MYGFKILCEISKGTFEISHKILNPYTTKYAFYCHQFLRVSHDIFELWRHKPWWDGPLKCWIWPSCMFHDTPHILTQQTSQIHYIPQLMFTVHALLHLVLVSLIARFMEPTWGPAGADRTQVGPMLTPWTSLPGMVMVHQARWLGSHYRGY